MNQDALKRQAAEVAVAAVEDGMVIGLGTGSTAKIAVDLLGERVRGGLRIVGVPTSENTASQARALGIPLGELADHPALDLTIDGADEVHIGTLDLIKGLGGALVREKIVAASSRRLVILVGPGKEVARLGARGRLPLEVIPFGIPLIHRRLARLGLFAEVRSAPSTAGHPGAELTPFLSDNGNMILDCRCGAIDDPVALEQALLNIPGVVDTGLFLGMAETVLIGHDDGTVQVRERARLPDQPDPLAERRA